MGRWRSEKRAGKKYLMGVKYMRKFTIGAIALFVLLAMALSVTAGPAEHKATGGGWFFFPDAEEKTTVTFTAQIDADGNVKGQIQVNDRPHGTFHVEVDYLLVQDNEAEISGLITKSDHTYFVVGDRIELYVVDNGEGKDVVDTIFDLPFNGNIQVS